jgi:hypothetical protein
MSIMLLYLLESFSISSFDSMHDVNDNGAALTSILLGATVSDSMKTFFQVY